MLFLSNVDKAQVILLSSGSEEQPESVQFGGSLVKVFCNTTLGTNDLAKHSAVDLLKSSLTLKFSQINNSNLSSICLSANIFIDGRILASY